MGIELHRSFQALNGDCAGRFVIWRCLPCRQYQPKDLKVICPDQGV